VGGSGGPSRIDTDLVDQLLGGDQIDSVDLIEPLNLVGKGAITASMRVLTVSIWTVSASIRSSIGCARKVWIWHSA
jgi:hypothetical protein